MRKIAFYTLGCKVNQADTASMEGIFRASGYEVVPFGEPADVYLVNTCVVTNTGQRKSRQIINRAVRHNPLSLVVVTGCYPQTAPEEVRAIEGVDVIIGNQERGRIVELVEEALEHKRTEILDNVQAACSMLPEPRRCRAAVGRACCGRTASPPISPKRSEPK